MSKLKILSIVGARPQFIKAAPMSRDLRQRHEEILLHTGQHYDYGMSDVFFAELGIPQPEYNLGIGSELHGAQTGAMLAAIEQVILQESPDWVLVYGDTNSTLAGALAATKLHIPIAHVEAGLRSFNWEMPEEVNRVLTDRCSQLLFCPTETAVSNLSREGIKKGVHHVGDVMYDALHYYLPRINEIEVLKHYKVTANKYVLATIHRPVNTDDAINLQAVLDCVSMSNLPVLLPLHPRTKVALSRFNLTLPSNIKAIDPVSYLSMLALEKNARFIMTDSGGVQKEAFMLQVPCITLRAETEWTETVSTNWNTLVDRDKNKTAKALSKTYPSDAPPPVFGNGTAVRDMINLMEQYSQ